MDELTEKVSIRFNSPQILDEKIFWAEVFCLGETENLQGGGGLINTNLALGYLKDDLGPCQTSISRSVL